MLALEFKKGMIFMSLLFVFTFTITFLTLVGVHKVLSVLAEFIDEKYNTKWNKKLEILFFVVLVALFFTTLIVI
jgi:hypothetical protein